MLLPFLHGTTYNLVLMCFQTPDALPRIRGPFTTETGEFVYTGDNEFVWYLCGDGQERLDILLGAPGFVAGENELCQENVKLRVSE
jgi:hypothetical protein